MLLDTAHGIALKQRLLYWHTAFGSTENGIEQFIFAAERQRPIHDGTVRTVRLIA